MERPQEPPPQSNRRKQRHIGQSLLTPGQDTSINANSLTFAQGTLCTRSSFPSHHCEAGVLIWNPFPDEEVEEEGRSRQQLEAELERPTCRAERYLLFFWNLAGSTILVNSTGDTPTTHCREPQDCLVVARHTQYQHASKPYFLLRMQLKVKFTGKASIRRMSSDILTLISKVTDKPETLKSPLSEHHSQMQIRGFPGGGPPWWRDPGSFL